MHQHPVGCMCAVLYAPCARAREAYTNGAGMGVCSRPIITLAAIHVQLCLKHQACPISAPGVLCTPRRERESRAGGRPWSGGAGGRARQWWTPWWALGAATGTGAGTGAQCRGGAALPGSGSRGVFGRWPWQCSTAEQLTGFGGVKGGRKCVCCRMRGGAHEPLPCTPPAHSHSPTCALTLTKMDPQHARTHTRTHTCTQPRQGLRAAAAAAGGQGRPRV